MQDVKKNEIGTLSIDATEVVFDSSISSKTIKISTNEEWIIDGEGKEMLLGINAAHWGWVYVELVSGDKSASITFKINKQAVTEDRKPVSLVIKSKSQQQVITVRYHCGS